eukprot:Nk52_evm17s2325 gene=Nk52_evmTU17s2325
MRGDSKKNIPPLQFSSPSSSHNNNNNNNNPDMDAPPPSYSEAITTPPPPPPCGIASTCSSHAPSPSSSSFNLLSQQPQHPYHNHSSTSPHNGNGNNSNSSSPLLQQQQQIYTTALYNNNNSNNIHNNYQSYGHVQGATALNHTSSPPGSYNHNYDAVPGSATGMGGGQARPAVREVLYASEISTDIKSGYGDRGFFSAIVDPACYLALFYMVVIDLPFSCLVFAVLSSLLFTGVALIIIVPVGMFFLIFYFNFLRFFSWFDLLANRLFLPEISNKAEFLPQKEPIEDSDPRRISSRRGFWDFIKGQFQYPRKFKSSMYFMLFNFIRSIVFFSLLMVFFAPTLIFAHVDTVTNVPDAVDNIPIAIRIVLVVFFLILSLNFAHVSGVVKRHLSCAFLGAPPAQARSHEIIYV